MAIQWRASQSAWGFGTSRTVNKPTGVVDGDMMLMHVTTGANGTTPSPPAGWTLEESYNTNSPTIHVYSKVASSEPASYNVTSLAAFHVVTVAAWYSDAAYDIVVDVSGITANTSTGTSVVFPSVTTTRGSGALCCFHSLGVASTTITPDAAMTERVETSSTSVVNYLMTEHPLSSTPGATGTRTATASASVANRNVSLVVAEDVPAALVYTANLGAYIQVSSNGPDGDPSSLTATPISDTQVDLAWTNGSSNETGTIIERSGASQTNWAAIATVAADVVAYSDTTVLEAQQYYYRVREFNADGYSDYSNIDGALTYPAAPTNVVISAGTPSDIAVDVTWTDNSGGETSQVIQHSTTSGSGYVTGATIAADAESGTDSSLNPSTEYYFRVGACNATGCTYSDEPDDPITTTSGPQVIQAPKKQLFIDWDRDGTYTDETDYFVEARFQHRIAPPGQSITGSQGQVAQCSITIDNSDKRFSSLNTLTSLYGDIQSGKMYHVPVIINLSVHFEGDDYVRAFTGVARIPTELTMTTRQARNITLDCRGMEETLLNKRQRTTQVDFSSSYDTGKYEDFRIADILVAEGLTGGGVDYITDSGMHLIPFSWLENESVVEAIWQLAAVCGGRFYARKDGILAYENAAHWLQSPHNTSQQSFTRSNFGSLELLWDETELAEEVVVNYTPREITEETTLFESDTIVVAPGATDIVWGQFDNPVYEISSITTTAGSPGGFDLSGSVTVTPTYYAASVKLSITNSASIDAYVNVIIAGHGTGTTKTKQLIATSSDSYWTDIVGRTRQISGNKFMQTRPMAEFLKSFLNGRQETPTLKMVMRGAPGEPRRAVGDRITVEDAELSLSATDFFITALSWSYSSRGFKMDIEGVRASDLYPYIDDYFFLGTSTLNGGDRVFF